MIMQRRVYLVVIELFFLLEIALSQNAGKDKVFLLSADFANRWTWRGVNYSNVPVIQPTLGFQKDGWKVYNWSSYSTSIQRMQEVDWDIYYTHKSFTFGFIDYFNMTDSLGAEHKYFNFNGRTTMHVFDATIIYNGPASFPIKLTASKWFYGNDRDKNGNNYYSTYLEVGFNIVIGDYTFKPLVGGTTGRGFYGNRAGVVNVAAGLAKSIKITDNFSLPLETTFAVNPQKQNVYVTVVATLK
jgi:hypothetical protein